MAPYRQYIVSFTATRRGYTLQLKKDAMIHITEARRELERGEPCQLKFWKRGTGEKVEAKECVCTSSNFERNTVNLKFLPSEEIRKIRVVTIFEFNGEEVVL